MYEKLHSLRFLPVISVFVWTSIAHGQDCACSTSTTPIDYPTAWASDETIVNQLKSAASVETVELIDAKQKNVTKHTFNRECGGIAKPPGPHFDESEWSRWSVKSTEEAVTFTIDHPIPAEHLKAGFG